MTNIRLTSTFFLILIIVSLAIAPAFALGEGNRNLLLIGVMLLSPIVLLKSQFLFRLDLLLLLFLLSIVFAPMLNHPESFRWSTVLYSTMFGLTFLAYEQLLYRNAFSLENYEKLLRYLIYAYFIVLVIQQISVMTGLPIFNISNYDPTEPWKLNSLSAEPSHSARIVALLMYCYITIKELVVDRKYSFNLDFKNDKWIWIAFLWTMTTMGSGTAFVFIAIILLKFMKPKSVFPLLVLVAIIFFIINLLGENSIDRSMKFLIAVLSFDEKTIMLADHSASLRVIPMMILAKMSSITTIDGWFGHGIDYVSTFLYQRIAGVPKGFSGGGLLQLWIEYGFLSFSLFIIFSFLTIYRKGDYISIIFWFMLVFMYSINSQILWLTVSLLYTNKYFFTKNNQLNKDITQ